MHYSCNFDLGLLTTFMVLATVLLIYLQISLSVGHMVAQLFYIENILHQVLHLLSILTLGPKHDLRHFLPSKQLADGCLYFTRCD